jgi:nucleoside-diphosphate-sugar epimerase
MITDGVLVHTLVTGATGRIGGRVLPALGLGGHVRVLVRDVPRAAPFWDAGCDVVIGDLTDPDTVKRAVTGVDAVLHLAAVDADVTAGVGRAALDAGVVRFVLPSTTRVYGPGRGRPAGEDDPPVPAGRYPRSTVAAERALLGLHHDGGLGIRILRFALVYGDGDPGLPAELPRLAVGPAHRRVHAVHHADVIQALRLALSANGVDGRIFNVADDAPLTAWDVCAITGHRLPGSAGAVDPWAGVVDTRRIRAELGYRPIYPTMYEAQADGAL